MVTTSLVKRRAKEVKQYLPDVNKNYVWGGVLIVAIAAGLYWWGKKNASIENTPVPDDTIDPNKPLTATEMSEIKTISLGFKSDIDSWFKTWIADWNVDNLERFMQSSDRIFVGVNNYVNANYVTAPDTLRILIDAKSNWIWGAAQGQLFDNIIDRFNRLGIQ